MPSLRAEALVRLVVSGYYGFGNAGDEAVLAGIVRAFAVRGVADDAGFTVLSADPGATAAEHGVRAIPRMDMAQVGRAIEGADALLSGGGSLLQDVTSLRSLLYYLWVIRLARRRGRPVAIYAQGVGPLRRPMSQWLVRRALSKVGLVTVRDEASANLLRRIGVQESRVTVTADPAFALDHPRPERQATGPRPVVGLAVRPWPGVDVAELATATVAALAGKGYGVELLPMQRTQDEALASEIAGRAGGAASIAAVAGAFRAALDASSSLACVAAMRLHALAFGAVSGTPLVGIAYDPKVTALMDTLGQGRYSVGLRDADPDRIVEFVEAAVADAPSVRTHLSIRVGWLREAALANVDRVCELVGRGVGARAVAR